LQISIIAVGRLKDSPEKALCDRYLGRMRSAVTIREVEERRKLSGDALKQREAALILDACPPGARIIALDEGGREATSRDLADRISMAQQDGTDLAFAIGGADGLSKEVLDRAALRLSFGRMTWPHMMVRAMLLEQLYRAQQILAGHPYHRD